MDSKENKFRKEIMENTTNLGELKMTNLKVFDGALKISLMKRLTTKEEGCAEFPMQLNIHKIPKYGDLYPKLIVKTIKNKFWKDKVNSVIKLMETFKIKNVTPLHWIPLWHNSKLNFEYRKRQEKMYITW